MRKSLSIILVVLIAALLAPNARAESYTANFIITSASSPGCFGPCFLPYAFTPTAPPVSFPSPTNILETWDSVALSIPLLNPADAPTDTYTWNSTFASSLYSYPPPYTEQYLNTWTLSIYDSTTNDSGFATQSICTGFPACTGLASDTLYIYNSGQLTFTAVPEPSTAVLMLSGIGFLLVMLKRLA